MFKEFKEFKDLRGQSRKTYLRGDHKTEVEKMLGVFDQNKLTSDHHVLNIDEEDYPEKYRPIIRRLQRAISEPMLRKKMDVEDEITNEFKKMARAIQKQKEDLIEKDKTLEENKKALQEKEKLIRELLKKKEGT